MRHSKSTQTGTPLPSGGLPRRDPGDHPAIARLLVDGAGSITTMSEGARKLLGYGPTSRFDRCFFAHIHGRNLIQVMRDVASMVCHDRSSAHWIVRMRTADSGWIWLRLVARKLRANEASDAWIAVGLERVSA